MDDLRKNLKESFENLYLSKDSKVADEDFVFKELLKVIMPKARPLFKYRSCTEYNILAFQNNEIYAPLPFKFNDPYDCLPYCDKEEDMVLVDEDGNEICIEKPLVFNDSFDDLFDGIRNSSFIACFAEDVSSILMWSHYTDCHKGFVLQYDFRDLLMSLKGEGFPFPVIYHDQRYNVTRYIHSLLKGNNGNILDSILLQLYKSIDWEYEKEWRMVIPKINKEGEDFKFYCKPKAIYYGSKISVEHKNQLHEIAVKKGIDEYQAQLDHFSSNYKMTLKKL
jgi:hypothetical protein